MPRMQQWRAYDKGSGFKLQVSIVVRQGRDLGPRPRRFPPSVFFFTGDVSLRTSLPPPLEWLPFPRLVAAVFIIPKGAESTGSGCIGVIGALVFLPSEAI